MGEHRRPYILGVDPGLSGALALIDRENSPHTLAWVVDMPLRIFDGQKTREIDLYHLASHLEPFKNLIHCAVVEDVASMTYMEKMPDGSRRKRGQGAAASFAFGRSAGVIHGALGAFGIPIHFVKPAVWKSIMNLSANKSDSRKKATQYFPTKSGLWARAKDDGRAEAVLLAKLGADRF